jgi:bisphosphoglycerate-independent phosphoglycerate mutase (AlkP superfamily)
LEFIDSQVTALVDAIVAADHEAVIVVFSDHGSGARWSETDPASADVDLRTANLLAVRSPGVSGIIDDRSTLANLLPRLLRAYTGTGPPDVPETVYAWAADPALARVFVRPD